MCDQRNRKYSISIGIQGVILFFAVLIYSCKSDSTCKYPGYSVTADSIYFKLQAFGESNVSPKAGDYLLSTLVFKTMKDSVFLQAPFNDGISRYYSVMPDRFRKGSFEKMYERMHEGDSVTCIVSAESVFNEFFKQPLPVFIAPHSQLKVDIKLNRIIAAAEFGQEWEKYKEKLENRDIEEQRKLKLYLKSVSPEPVPLDSGAYYLLISEGNGALPQMGNRISIHYKGTFLDGRVFDSTYSLSPLDFTYGEKDQVIRGIEKALHLMKAGGKAKIILPSQLAYGSQGSSTGIVPPFTSVVYELELVSVIDARIP